ncbi:threonine transporter [Pseudoalteromonas sp. HM-SA03]|uniref:LysE family translocator n=1 Tax=Pseudoalteromonas sp. HM-SA03 TaxID=2029678 RepID=UPI000BADE86D|nr:LysE family translocator [Pseudoalteromonas sp. HM-SA03]PAY02423.1 threonine transporter [Pseudoalteromonas sp. HM-SA03]
MSLFIIWFSAMFPLVFSPGPANIVFAASGANVGVRRSLGLLAGVDVVYILKSLLVGYSLGKVVESHPMALNIMQLIGAIYLIYLATKFFAATKNISANDSKKLGFIDGALLQILNSKGWVLVFIMFTLFSEQANDTFGALGNLILVLWLAILNISVHLVWIKAGDLLARVSNNPNYNKWLNRFYGGCLYLVAAWLIFDNEIWREGLI